MSVKRSTIELDELAATPETLTRKQVQEAIRKGSSLVEADMRASDLAGLSFDGVDLRWAKLAEANLTGCTFRNANLSRASLWHANLQGAVLDGATLEGADFDFANLDGVSIKGARFKKAIFPLGRLTIQTIQAAVKSGALLQMESSGMDDDE